MNGILPNSYVFNTQNVLTPTKMQVSWIDKMPNWVLYAIVIVIFLLLGIVALSFGYSNDDPDGFGIGLTFLVVSVIVVALGSTDSPNMPKDRPYKANCEFRLSNNSNLIVKQDKIHHPNYENETKSYPYQFYIQDPAMNTHLIHLGQADGKEINLDDSTNAGKIFASYYSYIQKHDLADEFANRLYFIKNTSGTSSVSQYVLKGDNIILKTKQNKAQKLQVYAEKRTIQ